MESDEIPEKKRKSSSKCVICECPLSDRPAVKTPTQEGLRTFLNAAEIRQDDVHKKLSKSRQDILDGSFQISYHRDCRATYTARGNLHSVGKRQYEPSTSQCNDLTDVNVPKRLRRTDTQRFDIRSQCFVCGFGHKRDEKLTPISKGSGMSTREKVLKAAVERKDDEIRLRLLAYPDLFAADAKYHRSCYSKYISERNIEAAKRKVDREHAQSHSPFDKAFMVFCRELESSILSYDKSVLSLSDMNRRFIEILHSEDAPYPDSYRAWKLKEKLKLHFKDRLVFITQRGKSDRVCSKDLSIGEALMNKDHIQLDTSEEGNYELNCDDDVLSDSMILHRAAGILRSKMADISFYSDSFPPSGELVVDKCKSFVPPSLLDFISWCTMKKAFENASTVSIGCADDSLLPILAICHNMIGISCTTPTPITFGLGIQMHHKFGSKQLIESLNSLGHSIAYDEVRRFLTSAAEDGVKEGPYVPRGIAKFHAEDVSTIVDGAIDNFDTNEDTLDGKRTTHCMAAVLYQRNTTKETPNGSGSGIPRSNNKAFDVSNYDEHPNTVFNKPQKRSEPARAADTTVFEVDSDESYRKAVMRDLVWLLSRLTDRLEALPAWTGFNALTTQSHVPVSLVRYLPFIQAPPTDFSTIYSVLLQLISIAKSIGQPHILVTADLAIYSKGQQILWTKGDELQRQVTMRLGGMHLTMAFLASIGRLYGDGGYQDILTSSGVYATASAALMLQGKPYARGIRGVKLVHEAMSHLFLTAAESFAEKNKMPWLDPEIAGLVTDLQASVAANDQPSASSIAVQLEGKLSKVVDSISQFRASGHSTGTFKYWDSFLEAGNVLLRLIRADKEGNFKLHLDAVAETVPYFILAGRSNYARYTPIYLMEMRRLREKQPIMHEFLMRGGFVVRRSSQKRFNSVPTDQALEQTINREGKGTGGVIGFTLRKGALLRWMLTRHVTGEYSDMFQELCSTQSEGGRIHDELGGAGKARDRGDVTRIKEYITEHCQNPFDIEETPRELVNITTGQVATTVIEESLLSIPEKGKTTMEKFVTDRLVDGQVKSYWDAIPKSSLGTFASMKKSLVGDHDEKVVIDTEVLFRRLLTVAKHREVDLKMVLSHELAAVPPSLFHDDGTMRKPTKSDLMDKLEKHCPQVLELKSNSHTPTAYIIDGMSIVQSVNESHFKTFDELAEIILKRITRLFKDLDLDVESLTLVFDRNDGTLIKGSERQRPGDTGVDRLSHQILGNRQVPSYRVFLQSGKNKASLIYFLSDYMLQNVPDKLPHGKIFIIAGGFEDRKVVKSVENNCIIDLREDFCTHDEADTRMILHAVSQSRYPCAIIRCDDTDVCVLLLHYQNRGLLSKEVFMHAGHSGKFTTRVRFIPVSQIAEKLGDTLCTYLPAVHALSGCDTTSGIFRLGKKTAFSVLQKKSENLAGLEDFHLPDKNAGLDAARKFILLMYGRTGKGGKGKSCDSLDELRYLMSSSTDKPVTSLPPTEDAFQQHALRAKLQTNIWCNSHVATHSIPDPENYGWKKCDVGFKCVRRLIAAVPKEIRDLTHLYCRDKDCTDVKKCPCKSAGLDCIEICGCDNCPNMLIITLEDDEDGDDAYN